MSSCRWCVYWRIPSSLSLSLLPDVFLSLSLSSSASVFLASRSLSPCHSGVRKLPLHVRRGRDDGDRLSDRESLAGGATLLERGQLWSIVRAEEKRETKKRTTRIDVNTRGKNIMQVEMTEEERKERTKDRTEGEESGNKSD